MIKAILAFITGIFVWIVVATIGNWLLRAALPGYASVEADMAFTLPMMFCRLTLGLLSSLCAGASCAAVATPGARAVSALALALVILFVPNHYLLWDKFPLWYHVFFLVSLAPMVLLGGVAYRRLILTRTTAWAK
jgi:hypothetical protein